MEGSFLHTNGITETPTAKICLRGHKPSVFKHKAGLQCRRLPKQKKRWEKKVKKNHTPSSSPPTCVPLGPSLEAGQESQTVGSPRPHARVCQTYCAGVLPAYVRVQCLYGRVPPSHLRGWCSQHIDVVVVRMLSKTQQASKNYFIRSLASLIFFF